MSIRRLTISNALLLLAIACGTAAAEENLKPAPEKPSVEEARAAVIAWIAKGQDSILLPLVPDLKKLTPKELEQNGVHIDGWSIGFCNIFPGRKEFSIELINASVYLFYSGTFTFDNKTWVAKGEISRRSCFVNWPPK